MRRYQLKTNPETSIELPNKPLELVVVELNDLIDFMDSELMEYMKNSKNLYPVTTKDDKIIPKKGIDIAKNVASRYVTERFYNAIEQGIIKSEVGSSEKDPFDFLGKYSILKVYERVTLFEKPHLLPHSIEMFQKSYDFFEDGFNLGLALAYIEKRGETNKELEECFKKKILEKDKEYSFFVSLLVYFLSDSEKSKTIH